jgi:hypothetical protein
MITDDKINEYASYFKQYCLTILGNTGVIDPHLPESLRKQLLNDKYLAFYNKTTGLLNDIRDAVFEDLDPKS